MNSAGFALLAAWAGWCVLHSFLIANPTLAFARKRLGLAFRFYRLAYVLFSLATVMPLFHFSRTLDPTPFLVWKGYYKLIPATGLALSALLFFAGGWHYDAAQFLGFRQMATGTSQLSLSKSNRLDTSGILNRIRHPWYTATFLLLWSHDLTLLGVEVGLLLTVYLVIGTILEERKLVEEFGDTYRDYQKRVSKFLPLKWLRSKVPGQGGSR